MQLLSLTRFLFVLFVFSLFAPIDSYSAQKKSSAQVSKPVKAENTEGEEEDDDADYSAGSHDEKPISPADGLTKAEYAYMIDYDTGAVLLDKNGNERMHPASMTKLMTAYLIFEKLKNGSISLDDKFHVSVEAWRMGGSKMFVKEGDDVAVSDLIRGIIVQSGNDACIVMAEGIAGSEQAFAEEMNETAKKLGLTGSAFVNSTGLPHNEHLMTARDLVVLARHIMEEFPEYYPLYSIKEFTYNNIKQQSRNKLLTRNIGADGMKTGYTEQSGYGMVASAVQNGRRLILAINGLKSGRERAAEAERLLRMGFRDFKNVSLFKSGEIVENAEVWMGKEKTVPLVINENLQYTVARSGKIDNREVAVTYEGPLMAPIKQGDHVADLIIKREGTEDKKIPLYAGKDIGKLSSIGRFMTKLRYFLNN